MTTQINYGFYAPISNEETPAKVEGTPVTLSKSKHGINVCALFKDMTPEFERLEAYQVVFRLGLPQAVVCVKKDDNKVVVITQNV